MEEAIAKQMTKGMVCFGMGGEVRVAYALETYYSRKVRFDN